MPQNSSNNHANPRTGSSRAEDASPSESPRQEADISADRRRFEASNAEEIEALEIDLEQDGDEFRDPDDGSGLIEDELARDQVEENTESGPELVDKGVDNAAPGRGDTSETLRRHFRHSSSTQAENVVDDTIDEPRDEAFADHKG